MNLPRTRKIVALLARTPAKSVTRKRVAFHPRRGKPGSDTDCRNLAMLRQAFSELMAVSAPVVERLRSAGVDARRVEVWREVEAQDF